MYKDKDKQREATREAVRRLREAKKGITEGITPEQGITSTVTSEGITSEEGITYPDIIDKLTDPVWRGKLEKICQSFKTRNPQDMEACWLGDMNLSTVCGWLECTA